MLPVYSVYKLQMPVYRKLAIIGIFLLGGLVTVTGIIRIHYLTLMYSALSRSTFDDVECEITISLIGRSTAESSFKTTMQHLTIGR